MRDMILIVIVVAIALLEVWGQRMDSRLEDWARGE
jgi:hypothetical protein